MGLKFHVDTTLRTPYKHISEIIFGYELYLTVRLHTHPSHINSEIEIKQQVLVHLWSKGVRYAGKVGK